MKFVWTIMMLIGLAAVVYLMDPRVWAEEVDRAPSSAGNTKAIMGQFLTNMEALKPFMVSDDKFADPKNFVEIDSHMKDLARLVKQAKHDPRLQLSGYRVSRKILEDHIVENERVFRLGNKPYARWMLNSTLSICMSCHTQIPTASRQMKDFEKLDTFTSSFDQAEFLFATRAFDQAKVIYEKGITGFPDSGFSTGQLETALRRMITYYARIQRNPEAATQALLTYQQNQNLPFFLKDSIKPWLKAFREWKKDGIVDPSKANDEEIVAFAQKNLDPKVSGYVMTAENPRAALYLKVSGILYEYLQAHPTSPATPDILYWLAICDKGLNNNFFFSLGDVYLRECIVRFPQSNTAKRCYDEYESDTILSYSGSGGTHLPDDVRKDLGQLKALLIAPKINGGGN